MRVMVTGRTQAQVEAVARDDRRSGARWRRLEARRRRALGERGRRRRSARVQRRHRAGPTTPLGDPDEWWRTFEVNVLGLYLCCNAFAPGMVERGGGRIVNIASGAAYLPPRATAADGLRREQGRRPPLLGAARGRPRAEERLRLLDQPGPRADGDDEPLPRRRAVDAAGISRRVSSSRSRRASSTRSRAATCTPSTTRPRACATGSTRSSSRT